MDLEQIEKTNSLKTLSVSDVVIKFVCPNCGEGIIIRRNKERKMGLKWICPVCGFEGP